MPQCAVVTCNNTHRKTKGRAVRYHRFPGDAATRARWVRACGRPVQNCATARVCSRHFGPESYERDVQHELLGLPTRCRLRRGAVPDANLPRADREDDDDDDRFDDRGEGPAAAARKGRESAIAVLLAVGLVPNAKLDRRNGGLPLDLNKMHVMEDVPEASDVPQPSSPGHADQRHDLLEDICKKEVEEEEEEDAVEPEAAVSAHLDISDMIKREQLPEEVKLEGNSIGNGMNGDCETHQIHNSQEDSNDNDDGIVAAGGSENGNGMKRKLEVEANECASKRINADIQKSFALRDKFLKKCVDSGGKNYDEIQSASEQVLGEIRALAELAKQKEKEWNNILHFKKLKEELLLRLERQKQVLLMNLGDFDDEQTSKHRNFNGRNSGDSISHNDYRQKIHRPVVDVKSLIADYRQKHPETVPRRGRRIRRGLPQNVLRSSGGGSNILNLSSVALGSGAQVMHNDGNLMGGGDSMDSNQDLTSFKDILAEFAKLSQTEKQEVLKGNSLRPPPPYPEVTVHPVPTTSSGSNSLLHGILTKNQPSKSEAKSTFSPTLARLLTAPEKTNPHTVNHNIGANHNVGSISDILSHSKARNEITITPVMGKYDGIMKTKNHTDEDEQEDSIDRLVIDEGGEMADGRSKDNNSDAGDDVPQCQGCNQKQAQFVCAGCGNQWYCSRDCQVAAWDEHSEVCSG